MGEGSTSRISNGDPISTVGPDILKLIVELCTISGYHVSRKG
jgi:hypothetical protein